MGGSNQAEVAIDRTDTIVNSLDIICTNTNIERIPRFRSSHRRNWRTNWTC